MDRHLIKTIIGPSVGHFFSFFNMGYVQRVPFLIIRPPFILVQSFWHGIGGGINLNKSDFSDFVIIR